MITITHIMVAYSDGGDLDWQAATSVHIGGGVTFGSTRGVADDETKEGE